MKTRIKEYIGEILPELLKISDEIFDLAELSCQEFKSCRILEEYLEKNGFTVE